MHNLALGAQRHGRRTRQFGAQSTEFEAPHWRLRSARAPRNVQVYAAHAHRPATDLIEPRSGTGPESTDTAATSSVSVFSYLGLGSRNSDSVEDDGSSGADGIVSRAGAAAAAGEAFLEQLESTFRVAKERLGSSLEQLFFDGVAEGLPGWPATQMAGVLMALALLHRRPDDVWLNEYWSLSGARLSECTTADLAMLSFGVSELRLQPPHEWTTALLTATLSLAEATSEGKKPAVLTSAATTAGGAAGDDGNGDLPGPRLEGAAAERSFGTTVQLLLQKLTWSASSGRQRQSRSSLWLPDGGGGGVGSRRHVRILPDALDRFLLQSGGNRRVAPDQAAPSGCVGGAGGPPAQVSILPPARDIRGQVEQPVSAVSNSSRVEADGDAGGGGGGAAYRPINSAYDMEDTFGAGPETSSTVAELVLEPLHALWGGLRQVTATVSSAWQKSRSASELVTVVYNLTSAGTNFEAAWLSRFLEVMRSRLCDLSGDDLHCLLVVAAEAADGGRTGGGVGGGLGAVKAGLSSRDWQAALFARMDGINWALQGHHLVGCLGSITALGLRPPSPWVRRQLRSLQPGLQFLPTSSLVQLGGLLPMLQLQYDSAVAAAVPPGTALNPRATSMSAASPDSAIRDRLWLERWMEEYRAAVSERSVKMEAADLLAVVAGVASVVAALPPVAAAASENTAPSDRPSSISYSSQSPSVPSSPRDVASLLLPRSGEVPYSEWRQAMVKAVATRLPESSLTGLCDTWQVLADATSFAQQQQQELILLHQQRQQAGVRGGDSAGDAVEFTGHLENLRELVASRIAVHPGQMSTSEVAPVFSSLAAAGLPLPSATLDALLTSAQPLLPGLTSSEIVTVALSLLRLSYKPNLAWQAAFCGASRRRLGLMTPPQRCSLLVASASLGLHLPDPWIRDFFAVSERGLGEQLDGTQLANLLWAVSCVASEPAASWLEQWEYASMPRLRELGPNMLAVVLKAMSTMHYRPSLAWQSAFFAALQRRLFAVGAVQLPWAASKADEQQQQQQQQRQGDEFNTLPSSTPPLSPSSSSSSSSSQSPSHMAPNPTAIQDFEQRWTAASSPPSSSCSSLPSESGSGFRGILSPAVSAEALNSLVYSLASLDLAPPAAWLDELADAIRCKLSLLSTLDLSVVLAYLVSRSHRPNDEWWESFLEALENRFHSLSASEMSSLLVMLNALKVSPAAQWLDAFCTATQPRLGFFQPSHLLQVLSCLHLFRHRPGQAWMAAYTAAVEGQLPRFSPTELARAMMLLDNLNQRPSAGFMLRFYDFSRPGLAQLDTQELVNVAWAVVSCSTLQPDIRWTEALVEAARPRLASLQQPQLRVLVAALSHMQRGVPCVAAGDFLAFAGEFLVL